MTATRGLQFFEGASRRLLYHLGARCMIYGDIHGVKYGEIAEILVVPFNVLLLVCMCCLGMLKT